MSFLQEFNKYLDKYAEVLMWGLRISRNEPLNLGEIVILNYDLPGLPLAEAVYKLLVEAGLNPLPKVKLSPNMEKTFYAQGTDSQLTFVAPGERELYENLAGQVHVLAPNSLTHLSEIEPKNIGKAAVARKFLRDILDRREAKGIFGWTLCLFPTDILAETAGVSLKEYAQKIAAACFLDRPNPVEHWKEVYLAANQIKTWLNSLPIQFIKVESENIELEIRLGERRKWLGTSGHNIPSFEVFTSPDWREARGNYFSDLPSYRSGNLVKGVRLHFEDGQASVISAEEGEDFVRRQISMDSGANKLGEFSLTDRRTSPIDAFMANTLFDENFGGQYGNCHIALGNAYLDCYDGPADEVQAGKRSELGFNESAMHWDLVNTERKRVSARLSGGQSINIYEDGQFAI